MVIRQWSQRWLPLVYVMVLIGAPLMAAETAAPAPPRLKSEDRLRRDITFLASDECEGRGPCTRGIEKAADYIAAEFKKAGLKPGGPHGSYFQPFLINGAVLEEPARLSLKGPRGQGIELTQGVQFWPMGLGAGGKDTAPLVFAGYGITSEKARYDDYAGLDVADKIVVLLRDAPQAADKDVARELKNGAPFARKIANAEKHGASAVLIVNDAETARTGDALLDFNYTALGRSAAKIPAFHVRRSVLENMLPGGADGLREIESAINRELNPHSQELTGWTGSLDVKISRGKKIELKNVVGVLEGAGPLAQETIVVGAHYDHLGYGGTSSMAGLKKMAIHHGADDNGSGTTALLELARRFAAMSERPGRRLVFIAFSGEELGLFGSDYYCKEPLYSLADTAVMFNLDMVGRLRKDKQTGRPKLLTEGSGTAKPFLGLLERLGEKYGFKMVNKPSGFGPSDHASFCGKDIPVLFVWTDYHEDYHRPTDTADKINVSGMRQVVDFAEDAVASLTEMPKPAYIRLKQPSTHAAATPRLGIVPAEGGEGHGLLIGEVAANEPAAKAGLKKDDLIVELAGKPIKNLQSYLEIMKNQKAGDTLEVGIVRNGQKQALQVKLESPYAGMPRLGIRPSYSDDGDGVLLDGVADDEPASRAGLKKGDRIVEMAGKSVKDLEGYMDILGGRKRGETIDVVILRNGAKQTVKVKLE
jgi:hypothetical protein